MIGLITAIISGISMSLQGVFNTRLSEKIGTWETNTFVQATGLILSLIILFFFRDGTFREIKSTNKLYLLGGILGVVITFTVMLSMKSLGVTIGTAVILIAQISASALIDAFGLFGTEKVPFSLHEILGIAIMIAGIVASLMQTGFLLTGEPLKPKFSKLNPISGFKNMFSKKSFVDLLKNLAVVTVIGFIGFLYVRDNYDKILQISNTYLPSLGGQVQDLVVGIFFQVSVVLVIIAAADYFVQFKFHQKDLRMTKQEIKEEYKQMEGDPQIKSKIKQKQREMATRRMMASVADATVVITNPTHLSIALKYEEGNNEAPKVVAKGADLVALKIKEVAKENDVPIMENKPLARMIYEQVDIDREVPQEMYQAVAEILAMVYKLKNKK